MVGIYKIQNLINNKIYIGQSVDIERRFREHCRRNEQQIDQAIQKYGKKSFTFDIIEECNPQDLNNREDYWIQYYNSVIPNGYNIGLCHNYSIGEQNSQSILTEDDVKLMRQLYAKKEYKTHKELWEKYFKDKIALNTFDEVFIGNRWSHIMPEVFSEENQLYHNNIERWNWMFHQNGEKNYAAVVTEWDARLIRQLYVWKERKVIFRLFPQYTERTITSIISGQNWQHLPIYQKRKKQWIFQKTYTEQDKIEWLKETEDVK